MDFQITPKFCWSRLKTSQLESVWGFYFIIDFSQGVYQEIHPYIAISIERVKINTSFHAMRKYLSYQSIEERGYHGKYCRCIAKSCWSMEISWKSIKMSGRVIEEVSRRWRWKFVASLPRREFTACGLNIPWSIPPYYTQPYPSILSYNIPGKILYFIPHCKNNCSLNIPKSIPPYYTLYFSIQNHTVL